MYLAARLMWLPIGGIIMEGKEGRERGERGRKGMGGEKEWLLWMGSKRGEIRGKKRERRGEEYDGKGGKMNVGN